MKTSFLILLHFFILGNLNCFSQAGNLDSTFGTNGIGAFSFVNAYDPVSFSK